ncbi:MAG: diphthine--ammonia ligase [Williamsia sp.]|nr:diphthine--ammonia ligase [Williamsia sp.]
MPRPKAVFCWSGGKDSALALYRILQENRFQVVSLLTTLEQDHRRVNMHRVQEQLLDEQAAAIGIPLEKAWVNNKSNHAYEQAMEAMFLLQKSSGVTHVVFGDIFLTDLRAYREQMLQRVGLEAIFPLWQQDTHSLMREFFRYGFRTVICCVSAAFFTEEDAGKDLDAGFIQQLPAGVDACGENGEFHTFCYSGPLFSKPVLFTRGEKTFELLEGGSTQNGFWFVDLLRAGK